MERLASASWLTTTKGRLPMPRYKLYATVTEEWTTEVDAKDMEEAKGIARDVNENWKHLDFKEHKALSAWNGDVNIYDIIELKNTKGEK